MGENNQTNSARAEVEDSFMADDTAAQWQRVRSRLRTEMGEATFNTWLRPLDYLVLEDRTVTLAAPTRFMRDWVVTHYSERLRSSWLAENPAVQEVDLVVRSGTGAVPLPPCGNDNGMGNGIGAPRINAPHAPSGGGGEVLPLTPRDALGAPLDARFRFSSFVVGKSNELAYAAARRVAESSEVTFNPLFLYGGVGLGKTHLMHAIAWHIRKRDPSRNVVYLSAEKFMYHFVKALRERDSITFKQQFRSVDVLMIDDVQFFSRKDSTQEEFFHTFNALADHNRQIVISADRSPSDLEDIEERIRSRLGCGLVADIHQTDYELRLGILQSKLKRSGSVDFPKKILEFLAHRITANVRELEGALTRLLAYSNLVGRPISLEMAQEVLQDLLRANDRRITIEEIQKKVAQYYNIRFTDMHSARRARNVARPRQVAMYLAKLLTTRSLPEIGRKFGGRDHTTVMHAVRRIEELRQTDAGLADDLELLRRMLEG